MTLQKNQCCKKKLIVKFHNQGDKRQGKNYFVAHFMLSSNGNYKGVKRSLISVFHGVCGRGGHTINIS